MSAALLFAPIVAGTVVLGLGVVLRRVTTGGSRVRRVPALGPPAPPSARRGITLPTDAPSPLAIGALALVTTIGVATGRALLAVLLVGSWWAWPRMTRRSADRRRRADLVDEVPDVVDLLAVAVGAGCNVRLAVEATAAAFDGPVGTALQGSLDAVDAGVRLGDALAATRATLAESTVAVGLIDALVDAERDGVALVAPLERIASEARAARRRRAEEQARRLPVALLFPLVLCVLPAFALLTVVPVLASSWSSIRL